MKPGRWVANPFGLSLAMLLSVAATAQGRQNAPPNSAALANPTAQSTSAQESPSPASFQLKVQSNLVLVRVVVRDKEGNPVRGLKKEDFRLFDQGREQTISQFEEVPSVLPPAPAAAQTSPAAAPPAAPQQRFIAFYFDEFNSSEANLVQARDAADRYLATGLQPNDHVAIFTAEKMLADFTSDPRKIHDALMQLHASTRGPANEHLCPDLSDYQAYQILQSNDMESDAWRVAIAEARSCQVTAFAGPSDPSRPNSAELQPIRMLAQRIVDQAQGLARANLEQFEKVVRYISKAPGQRSVVLVSPGFLSQSEQYALDRIIDRALRAQVVINSLDPKGLALLLRESQASTSAVILPDPRATAARFHLDASKEFVGADVLAEVAEGTGGEFFHSDNDLKAGFAALAEDPPHYVLAFSPQNGKWDGKFHSLKVTFATRERGHTIQARRGYFAVQNPVSSEPVDAANNAPFAQRASPPSQAAANSPVPTQPEPAPQVRIPLPPVAAPSLGPTSAYSSVSDANNPGDSTAPVPAPPSPVQLPRDPTARAQMPDPTQGLIRVDVTVTDNAGKPVTGLTEKDFKLLDNDEERKVVTFQAFDGATAQPAASHEVILVLDELNMVTNDAKIVGARRPDAIDEASARQNLAYAAALREVKAYLRANGGALREPTMVYRLTLNGLFAMPHTSMDGNELVSEIENPAVQRQVWSTSEVARDLAELSKGGPGSWRITHSLVALGSIAIEERRRPGRKLMFWIGNGWQIEHRRAAGLLDFSVELLTRMREARINLWGASEWPLYDAAGNTVAVEDFTDKEFLRGAKPDSIDLGFLSLPVIARLSGGGILSVPNNLALRLGEHVKAESNYYSLTFDPPRTTLVDEDHRLTMELKNPDLTARVFQDYYDEPVFYDQPPVRQLVTVKQLKDAIADAHKTSEGDLAHKVEGMELAERLDSTKLAELQKGVHGKAREALEVIADESAFLAPPPDEIPSTPRPAIAAQQEIVSRVISYIRNEIPSLPNLFATRTTEQYQEREPKPDETWKTAFPDQSLHEGETAKATIRFEDGKERVQEVSVKNLPDQFGRERLDTVGTFGPILAAVLRAATLPESEMAWSRWETSANKQLAVFRYRFPHQTPYFSAQFCCLAFDFDSVRFKEPAPFHGEITVDPSTGAIMRLTVQADPAWRLPLRRSDVMVEYEPITRGARTFICPARSVSLSRQRRTMALAEWGEALRVYGPFETLLSETRFEKYRIFGSTSRILPGFTVVPESK